ncbi:MAG: hypothetical protein ACRDXB_04525 [Actinomycetes bacterium]
MKVAAAAPPPVASLRPSRPRGTRRRRTGMADLAYALLLIGGFALLLVMMRGLQRL